LQYGFYGLGSALNLELLRVSRDYELEADQLGVQYAWDTGYDPGGYPRPRQYSLGGTLRF